MAPRPHEDEELSISLSPSQIRRNARDGSGNGNGNGNGNGSTSASSRAAAEARRHQSLDAAMNSTLGGGAAPHGHPPGVKGRTDARLEQYNIIKTLGEGSFGKVKLAVHKGTGQQVALKIIARKKLISRDMAGRVEREIEYLQLLRHPHIIKLYTVIKTPNDIIMVLEYAGGELFDYIVQHGRMKEAEARRFFQQMLCAVEYCHRHKIVHRDLKPENLLLDENLNVKIADFGLSNIMTDGNFLKTSCGSPNYAAPEVIGGKLYAGPEVDVWSCGVILYVLLVGRLPFDDEHIPSLFAKIARGSYVVPTWMSPGAAGLIKKMLVVNPVQRATIADIRQDPWFNVDLPEYLQLPVEPFFNTGIDPDKAIKISDIAPNASAKVQEKLHNEVTEKISKTMGYGKKDVQEALEAEEPSAIKDAYMIVRENKLMQGNPLLGPENPYFGQSPPDIADIPQGIDSLGAEGDAASPIASSSRSITSSTTTSVSGRPYVSKIGILPSSLPAYHREYMERGQAGGEELPPMPASLEPLGHPRTQAEQEETARRLKPHSRSQVRLDDANRRLQALTPAHPARKPKPVRWQFGIRSRNAPWEALICIYKALAKLGCGWVPDEEYEKFHGGEDNDDDDDYDGAPLQRERDLGDSTTSIDPLRLYKLPADPWHIQVRWTTEKLRNGAMVSQLHTAEEVAADKMHIRTHDNDDEFQVIAMRMDIQIYEMEQGVYLVDFKCDGYETAEGKVLEDKEVTSPFPFLDMAARLIMQLADAD